MNFLEAVKAEKKIKIGDRGYFYFSGSTIRFHSTKGERDFEVKIELEEIQRLLEKTLSDKKAPMGVDGNPGYSEEDVKVKIERIKARFNEETHDVGDSEEEPAWHIIQGTFIKILKEELGKRLI